VFNLDESIGQMMRSPRVLFGLLRYKVNALLGRLKLPSGFDDQLDPPGKDWTQGAVAPAEAAQAPT
jgi:hypothetical protein